MAIKKYVYLSKENHTKIKVEAAKRKIDTQSLADCIFNAYFNKFEKREKVYAKQKGKA